MGNRRLICERPATHSTGANTYCDDHGEGPPSHQVAKKKRRASKLGASEKQRQREADMKRYADAHVAKTEAARYSQPLPKPAKDSKGIGGYHSW